MITLNMLIESFQVLVVSRYSRGAGGNCSS